MFRHLSVGRSGRKTTYCDNQWIDKVIVPGRRNEKQNRGKRRKKREYVTVYKITTKRPARERSTGERRKTRERAHAAISREKMPPCGKRIGGERERKMGPHRESYSVKKEASQYVGEDGPRRKQVRYLTS